MNWWASQYNIDPGFRNGLGTGPLMVGGQTFPGRPGAQEFDWMEAGPPGTYLAAGAGMPMAMMGSLFAIKPAIRLDGREVFVGKVGQFHHNIHDILPEGWWNKKTETGWVDTEGNWLTQGQAARLVADKLQTPQSERSIWQGHSGYIGRLEKEYKP